MNRVFEVRREMKVNDPRIFISLLLTNCLVRRILQVVLYVYLKKNHIKENIVTVLHWNVSLAVSLVFYAMEQFD